jgi:hypothetical protein
MLVSDCISTSCDRDFVLPVDGVIIFDGSGVAAEVDAAAGAADGADAGASVLVGGDIKFNTLEATFLTASFTFCADALAS